MDRKDRKIEREFTDYLDKILAGEEVPAGKEMSRELLEAIDFARKMIALRVDPSPSFHTELKKKLLQKMVEQEMQTRQTEKKGWWDSMAWRAASAAAVLIILTVVGVLWYTRGFTPIPSPVPVPVPTTPTTPTTPTVPTAPTKPAAPAPTAPTTPTTPVPPPDTTPPPPIAGLIAINAYDGRANLWWERSIADDFDHYNIYLSQSEITDVTGIVPVHQIRDISTTNYQVTGLNNGTKYYFAVTAVDKHSNENKQVSSLSVVPAPMPRGTVDPDFSVDIYQSDTAWAGTTLLPDNHNPQKPRIIEVNMQGEVIWEYLVPQDLKRYTNPGFDVELLPNDNILLVLPGNGVYEINRNGKVVWSYLDKKVSHDADRLLNGNTLMVYGNEDGINDAQVKEVSPKGDIIWAWYARAHFDKSPYKDIYDQGWTHTNAAERLPNRNTLISLRNFNFVVEVDPQGAVVRTIGEAIFHNQHDPEVLPNGNILVANHARPHSALEIDPKTGKVFWQFAVPDRSIWPVRDANRLPNGNTLITGATTIFEVTSEGKIVWQLVIKGATFGGTPEAAGRGFYKAERISAER